MTPPSSQIKTCSRDPAPPPYNYVKGGGGIFNDMAVHDLDMTRFLAGEDPIEILAVGSCHIDKSIEDLPGSEAFDTATCIVRYPNGVNAMVDVCRQSGYGYDQRAEVLGTGGMIATDNVYPNTAKIYKNGACRAGPVPPERPRRYSSVVALSRHQCAHPSGLVLPPSPSARLHRQRRHALRLLPLAVL